jgi:ATP/maltotriose-dependent transcriptional regulator MalT/DNA-binding SARP family transcriptional activator
VFVAKLSPTPRDGHIGRRRLAARLTRATAGRLTLVVAGAGYGKTTLLRGWASSAPVAWHTVTAADRGPGFLSRQIVDALRLCVPNLSADLMVAATRLRGHDTDSLAQAEASAAGLAEALDGALRRDTVLVLDDVHEVTPAADAARFLAALSRQVPSLLHLVLVSRDPPPFRTARLLAHGEAAEIGAAELAFTLDEVEELVAGLLGVADPGLAEAVHAATSGWPVATRLAVQAIAGGPPAQRDVILDTVREPRGLLLDYMVDEVIGQEAPEVLAFLDRAEPLEVVDAALARAIGVPDAERVMAVVVRRGVYVEPRADHHGRVVLRPLFRAFLQTHRRLDAAVRRDVVAAAARWHESAGEHVEAIGYWASLSAAAECIRLLEAHGAELLADGHAQQVVDAAAVIPFAPGRPMLDVLVGDAWLLLGDWDEALRRYGRTASGDGPVPARVAWRTGLLHYLRGELDDAAKAYQDGDAEDPDLASRSLLLGWSASVRWLRGDLEGCRAQAADAFQAARSSSDHQALATAHTVLAMVAALDGDREANDVHYLHALDHATSARDVFQLVRIHTNRSSRHLEEGDPESSLVEVDLALRLADLAGFATWRGIALSNRGQALLALGRLDEARAELEAARTVFERLGSPMASYPLTPLGDVHRERGDRVAARAAYERAVRLSEQVSDTQGLVPALSGLARLLVADEPAEAARIAERALACGPSLGRVQALLAASVVALTRGAHSEAVQRAEQAAREATAVRDRAGLAEAYEVIGAARRDREAARTAVEMWRNLGNPIGAARASLVLAELESPPVAADLVARAAEDAQTLGARELAVRAQALARSVDPPEVALVCLGGFRVVRGSESVPATAWQSRKARDLLKLLVCRRGRPIHREQLAESLWPEEDPDRTANRLSVALSTVRTILDPEHRHPADYYVRSDGDAVALDHVAVDIEQFLTDAGTGLRLARSGQPHQAKRHLETAELAYTGDLFEDDLYADWTVDLREKARLMYLEVVRVLAGMSEPDRDARARYLLRILERDAYDERAHLDLVTLLAADGRHGEARRRYRLYCRRMDEIDVEAAAYPSVR